MNAFPEFQLNDFQIIKEIGKGNYGKVYLVEHIKDMKQYAAKESKESYDSNKTFLKEINSYSKVSNPAVLSLFGYSLVNFEGNPYPIMITEYLPNGSLGSLFEAERCSLASYKYTSTKKYIILLGIALGMKYLPMEGVFQLTLENQLNLLKKQI